MKNFICSFLIVVSIFCISAQAQKNVPYRAGEILTYEGKYSKIIKGLSVADLSFTVENAPNSPDFLVKAEARSKGTLTRLLNFKFYQNIQSTVDGTNFSIKRTVKRDEQGDRVRESEALFDYADGKVIYMETDPTDAARAPRQVASPITNDTHDFVSGLYSLRRLPLAVGKTFEITLSDSGLVYKVPVRVTGREMQKSILGNTWCFRVEPDIFGENRLIAGKGSMILWITDDARRLPVRAQINASIGRFEIRLKEMRAAPPAPKS